jgi:phosphoglycolate phosphatase-like HAD superfamily hydrolase
MILFDVDGVLLSEERCFDASALTVWELLFAPHFLGLEGGGFTTTPPEEEIRRIRKDVFLEDRVLDWMKKRGLNSNWDMVFLSFSAQLLLLLKELSSVDPDGVQTFLTEPVTADSLVWLGKRAAKLPETFRPAYDAVISLTEESDQADTRDLAGFFTELAFRWFDVKTKVFEPKGALWELGTRAFQEWYLGGALYMEVEGKRARVEKKEGFLHQEVPLAAPEQIRGVLDRIRQSGVKLGIGTGRTELETRVPLQTLGLLDLFDREHIATATDVIAAEKAFPELAPLGKPHPFTYVRSFLGKGASIRDCLAVPLPLAEGQKVLIVGDSVADLMAARRMGCDFAATLTGLTGQEARSQFEKLGADYILNDVTELGDLIV